MRADTSFCGHIVSGHVMVWVKFRSVYDIAFMLKSGSNAREMT